MRNRVFFFILVILASVSCQKVMGPGGGNGSRSIVCNISIPDNFETKSYKVNKDTLAKVGKKFRMDAWLESGNRGVARPEFDIDPHYLKDVIMENDGSQWKSSDTTVVWTNQIWTNFWAQYPDTLSGREPLYWPAAPSDITDEQEKTPSFRYDMSGYTEGQAADVTPDLAVAYAREEYCYDPVSPSGGVLKLTFAHVLSAIKFKPAQTVDPYCIDSVVIKGICTQGRCDLSVESGNSVSAKWTVDSPDLTASFGQAVRDGIPFREDKDSSYIFLIPQRLTDKATLTAFISGEYSGGPQTYCLEGVIWRPGYIYKYLLDFDPDKNSFTVTVAEEGGSYNNVPGEWIK